MISESSSTKKKKENTPRGEPGCRKNSDVNLMDVRTNIRPKWL